MIFIQWAEIVAGLKTETRRLVKENECAWASVDTPPSIVAVYGETRARFKVNQDYAIVPKRGQPAIRHGRINIKTIRRERLQELTENGARMEGVPDVAEYKRLWESINDKTRGARWDDNPEVWVITFEFVSRMV